MSRSSLWYRPKKPDKDWALKCRIEEVLRAHPSYGYRRLALHLKENKKKVQRVMRLFGIKRAFRELLTNLDSALKMAPRQFARLHAPDTLHALVH